MSMRKRKPDGLVVDFGVLVRVHGLGRLCAGAAGNVFLSQRGSRHVRCRVARSAGVTKRAARALGFGGACARR
jgi:hypothetical protein